jgi:hypothetical protein
MNYGDFKPGIVFFLFLTFSSVEGQDFEAFLDGRAKHTLGISGTFNPRFVLERSPGLPVDIIYRRFNTQNQAFRARIGGVYRKVSEESGVFYDREWNSSLGMGLGYEWHHTINNRFSWFYGAELGLTYYWLDRDQARPFTYLSKPWIQNKFSTIRAFELVLNGLGGVNFQLNRKFYLTLEQSISLSSQNYKSSDEGNLVPVGFSNEDNISSPGIGTLSFSHISIFFQTSLGIHFKF